MPTRAEPSLGRLESERAASLCAPATGAERGQLVALIDVLATGVHGAGQVLGDALSERTGAHVPDFPDDAAEALFTLLRRAPLDDLALRLLVPDLAGVALLPLRKQLPWLAIARVLDARRRWARGSRAVGLARLAEQARAVVGRKLRWPVSQLPNALLSQLGAARSDPPQDPRRTPQKVLRTILFQPRKHLTRERRAELRVTSLRAVLRTIGRAWDSSRP